MGLVLGSLQGERFALWFLTVQALSLLFLRGVLRTMQLVRGLWSGTVRLACQSTSTCARKSVSGSRTSHRCRPGKSPVCLFRPSNACGSHTSSPICTWVVPECTLSSAGSFLLRIPVQACMDRVGSDKTPTGLSSMLWNIPSVSLCGRRVPACRRWVCGIRDVLWTFLC